MKSDLEIDMLKTDWIVNKCKSSDVYAQNLYASMCNNRFFKNNEEWTCSWRVAGGIVADIRNVGEDYMTFYCSGIGSDKSDINDYVGEGFVTDEIRSDLSKIGWVIKPYEPRLKPGVYRNEW